MVCEGWFVKVVCEMIYGVGMVGGCEMIGGWFVMVGMVGGL